MRGREQAHLLLRMAQQDLYIMEAHVADMKLIDEMWGFHAQQAVEKMLKAMLTDLVLSIPLRIDWRSWRTSSASHGWTSLSGLSRCAA